MIINHNMNAMNAHRMMTGNTTASGKAMEKLSSGLRINRAGDDAAGLAISEKMRGQIRGLDQAARNGQDGISLIQTAEGALNETHSILQRMRELSVQAANDTNVGADRNEIQKEMNQLTSEINRIGNSTEFNTMKLLNGDRASTTSSSTKQIVAAEAAVDLNFTKGITKTDLDNMPDIKGGGAFSASNTITIDQTAIGWKNTSASGTITLEKIAGDKLSVKITTTATAGETLNIDDKLSLNEAGNYEYNANGVKFSISKEDYQKMGAIGAKVGIDVSQTEIAAGSKTTVSDFKSNVPTSSGGTVATVKGFEISKDSNWSDMDNVNIKWDKATNKLSITVKKDTGEIIKDEISKVLSAAGSFDYDNFGIKFKITTTSTSGSFEFDHKFKKENVVNTTPSDKSLSFQVGANENQAMVLDINDMRSVSLGLSSKDGGAGFALTKAVTKGTDNVAAEYALDVSSHKAAAASVTTIQKAIENVSGERSKLGAYQNRLEHTIANLGTSSENLQSAESRVRDVDMAKEMMNFSKNNILSQAAQAMLAQANQQPQGVLQLLR